MKSIFEMTGIERAGALLVALGPKTAADIIQCLDEEDVEKISVEMARIDGLSPHDREDIIGEFMIELRREGRGVRGGTNRARDLLIQAFGEERADEILSHVSEEEMEEEFEDINDIDDEIMARFLQDEHPQTIAVTLHYLKPKKSAALLKLFPENVSREAGLRMARMKSVNPAAVVGIVKTLKKRYRKFMAENGSTASGGIDSLISIMKNMGGDEERKLMENLDSSVPEISEKIREEVFSFDNIARLSNTEVRVLIDEVNDDHIIALSLKGADDDVRFRILRNMSRNRATDILEEMKVLGPVRLSEVKDNRKVIVNTMRNLYENGIITLAPEDGPLVE